MSIGAPKRIISWSRVSHNHQLVRSYLIAKRRGHRFQWREPPVPLVSKITILCRRYCPFLCNRPPKSANKFRIDEIPALVAPGARNIAEELPITDEWID
jgi:hypothetical protein